MTLADIPAGALVFVDANVLSDRGATFPQTVPFMSEKRR